MCFNPFSLFLKRGLLEAKESTRRGCVWPEFAGADKHSLGFGGFSRKAKENSPLLFYTHPPIHTHKCAGCVVEGEKKSDRMVKERGRWKVNTISRIDEC